MDEGVPHEGRNGSSLSTAGVVAVNGKVIKGKKSMDEDGTWEALISLAKDPNFLEASDEERLGRIQEFVIKHPLVELAYMTASDGLQTLPNTKNPRVKVVYGGDGVGVDRSSRSWYTAAVKDKKPFKSKPYLSVATLRKCKTISAPVLEEDGTLIGVLAADLRDGCH